MRRGETASPLAIRRDDGRIDLTKLAALKLHSDPVLALIIEHERLWQLNAKQTDAEANAIHDRLRRTKPTTLPGAITQMHFAVKYKDPKVADMVVEGMREMEPVELPSGFQGGVSPEEQRAISAGFDAVLKQGRRRKR